MRPRELVEKLRQAAQKKGLTSVIDVFRSMDANRDQKISREEFFSALPRLGLDLSAAEKRLLVSSFDVDGYGDIDYQAFVRVIGDSSGGPSHTPRSAAAQRVHNLLRTAVSSSQTTTEELFREFDKRNVGRFGREDMVKVLNEPPLRLQLDSFEIDSLMRQLDTTGKGYVNYSDFKAFVDRPHLLDEAGSLPRDSRSVKERLESLQRRLEAQIRSVRGVWGESSDPVREMRSAFQHYDPSRSGRVSRSAFVHSLSNLGFLLSGEEEGLLSHHFQDTRGAGPSALVDYERFLSWVSVPEMVKYDTVAEKVAKALQEVRYLMY